jgi:Mrp family chromosome partitioning ATPase
VEIRDALAALRAGWFLPVVGLLFGGGLACGVALLMTPMYTSSTQLFVSTTNSTTTAEAYQGSQFSENRVASYVQVLTSEELAGRVVRSLGVDLSPQQLQKEIVAEALPGTVVLNVEVTDPSPQRARDLAAGVATQFTAIVAELETPTGAAFPTVKVAVIDAPEVPQSPSSPVLSVAIGVGTLVGLVVGALSAYARFRLDRSVRDPAVASALTGAPVIGVIVRDESLLTQPSLRPNSSSPAAEAYRQLRTNLQFLNVDDPPKVVMISSAVPAEGKTTVAVNLALMLAEAGREVVLVEGDLRRPRVTRYLGMVGGTGLTNILAGTADLEEVLQQHGDSGLEVIQDLRGKSSFVLIDAPPLLPVADASVLAAMVDGVVLTTRYGVTRTDQLQQTRATLDRVGARTLGVILNSVPPKADVASAYGYGYGYG